MSGSDVGMAQAVTRPEVGSIIGRPREDYFPVIDSDLVGMVARSTNSQDSKQEVE